MATLKWKTIYLLYRIRNVEKCLVLKLDVLEIKCKFLRSAAGVHALAAEQA